MRRVVRRGRKAPIKVLYRLQGYDNSLPIVMEPLDAVYFQIPKIASSFLKAHFKEELGLPGPAPHATRFPIATRQELEAGAYDDYFKFGFVRNPWARIVSNYRTKITQRRNLNGTFQTRSLFHIMPKSASSGRHPLASLPVLNPHMSFREFVEAVASIDDEYAEKHFRSQHTFLCGADGELLVDYVGHLESFDDDFDHIAERIGLDTSGFPKRGGKRRGGYKDFFDAETWGMVAERYRRDIELFGYGEWHL